MQEETHINIFDFDETLFRIPNYTASEAKGIEPYDWFDDPQSLDDRFNIRGIKNTLDETRGSESLNFLVTHRVLACKPAVLQLLMNHGAKFDEVFFLGRAESKSIIVSKIILDHLNIKVVTIYEDSLFEIIKYTEEFIKSGLIDKVRFKFVDQSKIITLDTSAVKSLTSAYKLDKLNLE